MKTFTDNQARDWQVAINVAAIKRVRDTLDVDLLAVDEKLFEQLIGDPVLLVDLLYVLCRKQAEDRDISDEEFGEAMAGDAVEQATQALLRELTDFFPEAKRQVLRKALDKLDRLQATAIRIAIDKLDDPQLDAQLEAMLRGRPSTALPASSASTPTR